MLLSRLCFVKQKLPLVGCLVVYLTPGTYASSQYGDTVLGI